MILTRSIPANRAVKVKRDNRSHKARTAVASLVLLVALNAAPLFMLGSPASAAPAPLPMMPNPAIAAAVTNPQPATKNQCGSGKRAVKTSINFGCYGESCTPDCSPLIDATFAIVRFLSAGVGIVIVGSTVYAGVQYISARDDPSAVAKAKSRITGNFLALLLFIFGYAILNYVIPAGFFQ